MGQGRQDGGQYSLDAQEHPRPRHPARLQEPPLDRNHVGRLARSLQQGQGQGAPATAVHVRDIVKQIYGFAILHGEKVFNPADDVGPSSIATFVPKDRALSPVEIRLMHHQLETVASYPTIRLALRLILLTLVRKGELIHATWNEIDFENALWTIPKERMKGSKAHNVYLSQQALDIMVALRTCAGGSRYVLPSRYEPDKCMSNATLNRVTQLVAARAKEKACPWTALPCMTCAVPARPS